MDKINQVQPVVFDKLIFLSNFFNSENGISMCLALRQTKPHVMSDELYSYTECNETITLSAVTSSRF